MQGVNGGGDDHADALRFRLCRRERQVPNAVRHIGLVPEFGSSFSLPARMGYLRAAELISARAAFHATRAAELGLVTRVVPDAELLATATATAQKLAAKAISALRVSKRLIKQASIGPLREAMKIENQEFIERLGSAKSKEALSAFLEKRPPNFTNTTTHLAAE